MAQHIGKGHLMVYENLKYHINVPKLLTELQLSDKHSRYLKSINILAGLLDAIAIRGMQIGDPILLELLEQMKMIMPIEEGHTK